MRHMGIPKIQTLKATKRSSERFRVRWDRGSKSFTDSDQTEVMHFALDLVANDYPRALGKLYGKSARQAQRRAANAANERTFQTVAELYLTTLDVTPGYLRDYRRNLKNHAYPHFGSKHINAVDVEDIEGAASAHVLPIALVNASSIEGAASAHVLPIALVNASSVACGDRSSTTRMERTRQPLSGGIQPYQR